LVASPDDVAFERRSRYAGAPSKRGV
jgi:hypothetical protein